MVSIDSTMCCVHGFLFAAISSKAASFVMAFTLSHHSSLPNVGVEMRCALSKVVYKPETASAVLQWVSQIFSAACVAQMTMTTSQWMGAYSAQSATVLLSGTPPVRLMRRGGGVRGEYEMGLKEEEG